MKTVPIIPKMFFEALLRLGRVSVSLSLSLYFCLSSLPSLCPSLCLSISLSLPLSLSLSGTLAHQSVPHWTIGQPGLLEGVTLTSGSSLSSPVTWSAEVASRKRAGQWKQKKPGERFHVCFSLFMVIFIPHSLSCRVLHQPWSWHNSEGYLSLVKWVGLEGNSQSSLLTPPANRINHLPLPLCGM